LSVVSTIVFIAIFFVIITNAPNWETFRQSFFDPQVFADSLPLILEAFKINVALFLVAEVFILVLAMILAVMRSLPGSCDPSCCPRSRAATRAPTRRSTGPSQLS